MRKYSLLSLAFLISACATQGQGVRLPERDGDVLTYTYHCTQGKIRVEYARLGGQDSATIGFTTAKDDHLRKVLLRSGEHRFALDDWQWSAQNDGRSYTLQQNGQVLFANCQGTKRAVFDGKEDHQGTVRLNFGRVFAE